MSQFHIFVVRVAMFSCFSPSSGSSIVHRSLNKASIFQWIFSVVIGEQSLERVGVGGSVRVVDKGLVRKKNDQVHNLRSYVLGATLSVAVALKPRRFLRTLRSPKRMMQTAGR